MAKLKFTVHPLFFLFGVYFAATGRIFVFLTYTLVAVLHEMGHSIAAARLGYRLNRVVLMPYGAVISGDIRGLKFKDEIEVALAGPFTNLACAVLFAALWWVTPDTYAFTDTAMFASLSIAAVNLLPCRPLDGGRVLHAFLSIYLKRRTADIVLLITGVLFSCVLGGLFVISCFSAPNLSLLFFALFALFGTVFTGKDNGYVKLYENAYARALDRGAEVRRVAVPPDTTVKKLLSMMDGQSLTEVAVYTRRGEFLGLLPPERVFEIASGDTLYSSVSEFLPAGNHARPSPSASVARPAVPPQSAQTRGTSQSVATRSAACSVNIYNAPAHAEESERTILSPRAGLQGLNTGHRTQPSAGLQGLNAAHRTQPPAGLQGLNAGHRAQSTVGLHAQSHAGLHSQSHTGLHLNRGLNFLTKLRKP